MEPEPFRLGIFVKGLMGIFDLEKNALKIKVSKK